MKSDGRSVLATPSVRSAASRGSGPSVFFPAALSAAESKRTGGVAPPAAHRGIRDRLSVVTVPREPGVSEVRVTVTEHEPRDGSGRALFVSVRVWKSGRRGEFRPTFAGIALKPEEAERIADALKLAARIAVEIDRR